MREARFVLGVLALTLACSEGRVPVEPSDSSVADAANDAGRPDAAMDAARPDSAVPDGGAVDATVDARTDAMTTMDAMVDARVDGCASTTEVCANGMDDDCDGVIDDGCPPCNLDALRANTSNTGAVEYGYCLVLKRHVDATGRTFWGAELDRGMTRLSLTTNLFASREVMPAALTNAEYVTLAYRRILGREPDAEGAAYYTRSLDEGFARPDLATHLASSAEFCMLHTPLRHAMCPAL